MLYSLGFSNPLILDFGVSTKECDSKFGKPVKVVDLDGRQTRVYDLKQYSISVTLEGDVATGIVYSSHHNQKHINSIHLLEQMSLGEITKFLSMYADLDNWLDGLSGEGKKFYITKDKRYLALSAHCISIAIFDTKHSKLAKDMNITPYLKAIR